MGKYSEMLEFIKERFGRYQILGINPANVTDEIARRAYEEKIREMNLMLADCEQGYEEVEEIETIMRTAFDDAYNAVKDENSREHYQELLDGKEEER